MTTLTACEPQALSRHQREVFEYLYETTRDLGYQPSYREIGRHFGWASPASSAQQTLHRIRQRGWIELPNASSRAIRFLFRPDGTPFDGFVDKPRRGS